MALRTFSHGLKLAGCGLVAIMVQACGTMQKTQSAMGVGDEKYRDAIGVYTDPAADAGMDPIAAAAFWGTRYNTNQSDPAIAVKFSQSLRKIGSSEEAVNIMQKTAGLYGEDAAVSLEYGKVLVENGRAFEAVRHLEKAVAQRPTDWSAISAYGVALDQIGEHKSARTQYNRALSMAPGAISVMNNKGLSYALEGDLSKARATLYEAAGRAGGDARIRQNLALVLALSGEMREAERLARSDLPPQVADNNIDFFRQLMSQPAYWGEYAAADTPTFDAPAAPLTPQRAPELREQPKPEPETPDADEPIALLEAAPLTSIAAEPADLTNTKEPQ